MSSASPTWRHRLGVAMMAAALAMATAVAASGAAAAQETEGMPEEAEQGEITRSAFYDAPLLSILPPVLVQSFPPGAICLVEPKPCTGVFHEDQPDAVREGYQGARGVVNEGLDTARENDPNEPVSPVRDGTLPAAITTGQIRYRSAVAFQLPQVPSGHQVDSFKVYLTQTEPSGGVSSPVARQAILAALTCAREDPESPVPPEFPEQMRRCQGDQFEKIFSMDCEGRPTEEPNSCPVEESTLELEMCAVADDPFTEERDAEWEDGRGQDPEKLPETDCFLGSNGRLLEDGETWEFDLTFALQDWASGSIPNEGVLISPQAAPNYAYGDPESTFNKQVTFLEEIHYTVATSPEPEPFDSDFGDSGFGSGGTSGSSTTGGSSGGFGAPGGASTGGNMSSFSAPANDEPAASSEPEPEIAAGDGGGPAAEAPATEPVAAGPGEEPGSAWYTWLLAPVFLAGMWLTAQSLTAAPAAAATAREGAMSRLIQQQQAGASGVTGPQLV